MANITDGFGGDGLKGHNCDGPVTIIIHDASAPEGFDDVVRESLDGDEDLLGLFEELVEVGDRDPVGIPTFSDGVTLHERKDGPTSLSRRAEIDFPIEGVGDTWTKYIDAFREHGKVQKCTILMRPDSYDEVGALTADEQIEVERNVLSGYIGAVGANGGNTGHLTVFGPYNLLQNIPVGVHLEPTSEEYGTLRSIAQVFAERFSDGQEIYNVEDVSINLVGLAPGDDFNITPYASGKDFSGNRDTLVDVARWIREELGFKLWFHPTDPGKVEMRIEAMSDQSLDQTDPTEFIERFQGNAVGSAQALLDSRGDFSTTYDATSDDSPVEILNNNALYEMKPHNAIQIKGGTNLIETDHTYPEATAWYPPLVERAGGRITVQGESSKSSPGAAEEEARARLKESLDGVSGGTMEVMLAPYINPYDKIIAQPACNSQVSTELPKLVYEVQRTAHKINPNNRNNGNPVYTTELAVSMAIEESLIKSSSTSKNIQPSKDSDNKPNTAAPWETMTWDITL